MMMNDSRQYASATLRNRDFILGILRDVLPTKGVILEIASGSRLIPLTQVRLYIVDREDLRGLSRLMMSQ